MRQSSAPNLAVADVELTDGELLQFYPADMRS